MRFWGGIKYLIPLLSLGSAFWLNAETDRRREAVQAALSSESFLEQIDINHASPMEIEALPHIGKTLAERIVQYRHRNGFYQTPSDLLNVHGIGPKQLERITPHLTLSLHHDGNGE